MRRVHRLRTDEEAEAFLDQDLSDLDFSQFKAGQLEYERKDARLTMRLPRPMLDAVEQQARAGNSLSTAGPRGDRERERFRPLTLPGASDCFFFGIRREKRGLTPKAPAEAVADTV